MTQGERQFILLERRGESTREIAMGQSLEEVVVKADAKAGGIVSDRGDDDLMPEFDMEGFL